MTDQSLPLLPHATFPDGARVPALGLGTWKMGEERRRAAREAAALSGGVDLGMTLIDTAEMYGEGGAEEVVASVIATRRDRAFVVSKVYPHNAGRKSAVSACERSLKRLRTDRLDLYLLHWRGRIPLAETVDAFERLRTAGKIVRWGVSNFDTADMRELFALPEGRHCATNQVLYHLGERGIEWELVPWLAERGIPVMAYSPLGQGGLLRKPKLVAIARKLGVTSAQIALRWVLRMPNVIAIPQSSDPSTFARIAPRPECRSPQRRFSKSTPRRRRRKDRRRSLPPDAAPYGLTPGAQGRTRARGRSSSTLRAFHPPRGAFRSRCAQCPDRHLQAFFALQLRPNPGTVAA
jgi:diketogulonate reductase-like aldo/keto reductase